MDDASEWPMVTLDSLVEDGKISYGIVQPGSEDSDGVPIVRVKDVRDGRVSVNSPAYVAPEISTRHSKTLLHGGEVLLTLVGSVGHAAVADASLKNWNVARAIAVLRPRAVEANWLRTCFDTPVVKAQVAAALNTTVQATLNLSDLKRIRVPMPETATRRAIAEVLGALDDKIALNRSVEQTSHDLAQAHFTRTMRTATQVGTVGALMSFKYGKSLPRTRRIKGNVDVYGSGGVVGTHNEAIVDGPGVVVGRKGTAGAVHWAPSDFFPIDTTFYVEPLESHVSLQFCYFLLHSLRLGDNNADSAVPGLNRNTAESTKVKVPDPTSIRAFTDVAAPLLKLAAARSTESRALGATRDALLPALMSGKLRVKDAERQVEAVV